MQISGLREAPVWRPASFSHRPRRGAKKRQRPCRHPQEVASVRFRGGRMGSGEGKREGLSRSLVPELAKGGMEKEETKHWLSKTNYKQKFGNSDV
jgi:hypothetical protein